MTAAKDAADPHYKSEISTVEPEPNYTPTKGEWKLAHALVSGPAPQTAMMVHLKMLQVMGRLMKLPEVPLVIRDQVARCLTFARSPTLKEMGRFDRGGNRATKIRKLREFLRALWAASGALISVCAGWSDVPAGRPSRSSSRAGYGSRATGPGTPTMGTHDSHGDVGRGGYSAETLGQPARRFAYHSQIHHGAH